MRGISRRLEERVYNYEGITFDDVLMLPSFSKIDKESANLDFEFKGILFRLPIISSPMDTVTGFAMAIEMSINGGLGILHNNLPIEDKIKFINNIKDFNLTQEAYKTCSYLIKSKTLPAACAVGIGKYDDIKRIMLETDVDILCVDTAHGLTDKVIETIRYIKKLNRDFGKNALIMAGNVATEEATALAYEGVDFLRVGIGSGQICTTRIVMGIGVPQLTAIDMVKTSLINTEFSEKVMIISDGGIKQLGDINKALAFGADFVMLGSLLSCYEESEGEKIDGNEGRRYKVYRGMGSEDAIKDNKARYSNGNSNGTPISEGIVTQVEIKGGVVNFLTLIKKAIKGCMFYTGHDNLLDFKTGVGFIRVSPTTNKESHPSHSLTKKESSYL